MSRPLNTSNRDYPERYLANVGDRQFHDLLNEDDRCNIVDIIDQRQDIAYEYEDEAKRDGYIPCIYCMPEEY